MLSQYLSNAYFPYNTDTQTRVAMNARFHDSVENIDELAKVRK